MFVSASSNPFYYRVLKLDFLERTRYKTIGIGRLFGGCWFFSLDLYYV